MVDGPGPEFSDLIVDHRQAYLRRITNRTINLPVHIADAWYTLKGIRVGTGECDPQAVPFMDKDGDRH